MCNRRNALNGNFVWWFELFFCIVSDQHGTYLMKFPPGLIVCSYGLSIGLGHVVVHWGNGLKFGFWFPFVANILSCYAYTCLYFGISEMISVMPFSGGSFGFTRVTLNPFLGMLSAFGECADYLCQIMFLLWSLSRLFTDEFQSDSDFQPIYWFGLIFAIYFLNTIQRSYYSKFYATLPFICLILLSIYFFGNISTMDYARHVKKEQQQEMNITYSAVNFVRSMPYTSIYYLGFEAMPLWCKDIEKPALHVPRAMVVVTVLAAVHGILLLIAVPTMHPGIRATSTGHFPLTNGFATVFGITQRRWAALFNLPFLLCGIFAFMHAAIKQLAAMFRSNVVTSPFSKLVSCFIADRDKEIGAIISSFRIILVVLLVVWYTCRQYMKFLYNVGLLSSLLSAQCTLLNFIIFRIKYSTLKRGFVNPFGVYGAAAAMIIFMVMIVSVAFLQEDDHFALYTVLSWTASLTTGYFFVFRFRQIYSAEESAILFLAHVMKANEYRRRLIRRAAQRLRQRLKRKVAANKVVPARIPPLISAGDVPPNSLTAGRNEAEGGENRPSAMTKQKSVQFDELELSPKSGRRLKPGAECSVAPGDDSVAGSAGGDSTSAQRRYAASNEWCDTSGSEEDSSTFRSSAMRHPVISKLANQVYSFFDVTTVLPEEVVELQFRENYNHVRLPPISLTKELQRGHSKIERKKREAAADGGGSGSEPESTVTQSMLSEQLSEQEAAVQLVDFDEIVEAVFQQDDNQLLQQRQRSDSHEAPLEQQE